LAKMKTMPDDKQGNDVEKFLTEQKSLEDRKQALIADLLKQKEAAMKDFDEKLAKLGYHANSSARTRRSHHKKSGASSPEVSERPKSKS
jgi:hypothetical protein